MDEESNWALSCRACNLFKSDQVQATDPKTGATVRLFNPRRDVWNEHFVVGSSGAIDGLTEIGRATAASLRMNRPIQLAARQQWMRLRLFPA